MSSDENKILFGSEEWLEAYKVKLSENEAYKKAAKDWEGDFVFAVTPDGTGNLKEEMRMYLDLWHGECREAYKITPDRPAPDGVEYVYSGKYANWLKLIDGKIGPLKGIMQRKFVVKCSPASMAKMMRYLKAAQELVKCTASIENVEFP